MPRKLLVIDDEPDIREVATLTIELTDHWTVVTADSGSAGTALARSMQPDAILLDAMIPGMDGPSTLRALLEESSTKSIPVIFLTAKVHPADRQKFMRLGARGIIAKPFDPLELAQQIKDLLSWE